MEDGMEWEETCGCFIGREGLMVSRMGRHRKLLSRLIASLLPHDAPLFCHQYRGENIKMMKEGVGVEAFYVCHKKKVEEIALELESLAGQALEDVPAESRFLLEINFNNLNKSNVDSQKYWILAINEALTAQQHQLAS
jgi:hypothetical protein